MSVAEQQCRQARHSLKDADFNWEDRSTSKAN
jgi:hypothetical protein